MGKLWVIGCGFCTPTVNHADSTAWPHKLFDKLKSMGKVNSIMVDGQGSRDLQTIIDIFLKLLPDIKKEDYVILSLPPPRWRIPLDKKYRDEIPGYNPVGKIRNETLFVGNTGFIEDMVKYLEKGVSPISYYLSPLLSKKGMEFNKIMKILGYSNAVKLNYIELLKSFKKYFPFRLEYFSWREYWDDCGSFLHTKKRITEKVGYWEASSKDDVHWTIDYHIQFTKYMIGELL